MYQHKEWTRLHTLAASSIKLHIAVGHIISLSEMLSIKFRIAPDATFFSYFVVVPELTEPIIIGCNFFNYYKAILDFKRDVILISLPNGDVTEISWQHTGLTNHL